MTGIRWLLCLIEPVLPDKAIYFGMQEEADVFSLSDSFADESRTDFHERRIDQLYSGR